MLNSCWTTWWVRIMKSWVESDSLDCRFMMATCTTPIEPGKSLVELEEEWLVGQTKDERSESFEDFFPVLRL